MSKFLQSGIILGIFLPYLHAMIFSLEAQSSKQSRQKCGLMRIISFALPTCVMTPIQVTSNNYCSTQSLLPSRFPRLV